MAKAKKDWLKAAVVVRDDVELEPETIESPSGLCVEAGDGSGQFEITPHIGPATTMSPNEFKDLTLIGLAMWPELAKE